MSGKVSNIYLVDKEIYLYMGKYYIPDYDDHLCAYKIEDFKFQKLISINYLYHYHPFNSCTTLSGEN
jgi:hypothetical protein